MRPATCAARAGLSSIDTGREHRLHADTARAQFGAELFEGDALMRRVLIDQDQSVVAFKRDITGENLPENLETRIHRYSRSVPLSLRPR